MEKKTVDISLDILIRECSIDKNRLEDHYLYFLTVNRENIHEIFKYKKFNNDFISKLSCYCDDDYIIGRIRPSYDLFLNDLLSLLNISEEENIKDDDALTNIMLSKIEKLKTIETESDLKKSFPLLYKDLMTGRRYFNDIQKLRTEEGKKTDEYVSGEHYYYSCGMKKSLKNFIQTQSKMYERYVLDRNKYKEKIETTTSFNNYLRQNFDINKIAIYVMHEYLSVCERTNNRNEIKYYLKKIDKYLNNNNYRKDAQIKINNEVIDIDNIMTRHNNLKRQLKEDSSVVEWVIIPGGRDYKRVSSNIKKQNITLLNYEELNRIKKIGEERNNFYESTNYTLKVIGLRRYRGYVAYIYPNGEILIDVEYHKDRPSLIGKNAIYNLKVYDFEMLSKLDKKSLSKNEKVTRIRHIKNWQDKCRKIIERPSSEKDLEEVKTLVKKLKEKRTD